MHANRLNSRIFDTRIFSPLLERHRKHAALRGYDFCVGTQIKDGLARRGLSVPSSKESAETY